MGIITHRKERIVRILYIYIYIKEKEGEQERKKVGYVCRRRKLTARQVEENILGEASTR
jgi:hypothetical protein